jgi:hypothetical protein
MSGARAFFFTPRGFAPRTPPHAPSLAASTARSGRVARFAALARVVSRGTLSRRSTGLIQRAPGRRVRHSGLGTVAQSAKVARVAALARVVSRVALPPWRGLILES